MTLQTVEQIGMPFDEFMEQQQNQPFELLNGKRMDKMPNPWIHSWYIRFLFRLLDNHVMQHQHGEIFQETTYAQVIGKQWVKESRIPDLMFFAADRVPHFLASIEQDTTLPFAIAPDLTIEVLSSSERAVDVNRKVKADIAQGVRLIWVIDPIEQVVTQYYGGTILQLEDMLDGLDVLPGFQLSLTTLFAAGLPS